MTKLLTIKFVKDAQGKPQLEVSRSGVEGKEAIIMGPFDDMAEAQAMAVRLTGAVLGEEK